MCRVESLGQLSYDDKHLLSVREGFLSKTEHVIKLCAYLFHSFAVSGSSAVEITPDHFEGLVSARVFCQRQFLHQGLKIPYDTVQDLSSVIRERIRFPPVLKLLPFGRSGCIKQLRSRNRRICQPVFDSFELPELLCQYLFTIISLFKVLHNSVKDQAQK